MFKYSFSLLQHLLVHCDTCRQHYHLGCLDPPLTRMPKKSRLYAWECSECHRSSSSDDNVVIVDANGNAGNMGRAKRQAAARSAMAWSRHNSDDDEVEVWEQLPSPVLRDSIIHANSKSVPASTSSSSDQPPSATKKGRTPAKKSKSKVINTSNSATGSTPLTNGKSPIAAAAAAAKAAAAAASQNNSVHGKTTDEIMFGILRA